MPTFEEIIADRHPGTKQLARHFSYAHLPEPLRYASEQCYYLMCTMVARLPDGPELTAGLRKLLEAKDCFVRASLDLPDGMSSASQLTTAEANAQRLQDAIQAFIDVDDELRVEDYEDHCCMSHEDARRRANAVMKLTQAFMGP